MYKNYLFDLYGTLIDINTDEWCDELWEKMALIYSMSGAPYTAKELNKRYDELVMDEKERVPKEKYSTYPEPLIDNVFSRLYEEKGVKYSDEIVAFTGMVFRSISIKFIKLYDGVHELFDAIREHGGKIYLLSNAQRTFTEPEIRLMGLYDEFEYIMISSDEGCAKPDVKIYQNMMKKFNMKPEETIMIGNDYLSDIKGAYDAGIDSLYIDTDISPKIKGQLLAKYKIISGSLFDAKDALFGRR